MTREARKRWTRMLVLAVAGALVPGCNRPPVIPPPEEPAARHRMIVFVWDGLRPDFINAQDTPNVHALRTRGVWFSDNHSTYPTFTLINGATFATGAFPDVTGFNGNFAYAPTATGKNANGVETSYLRPVAVDDWRLLDNLGAYYDQTFHEPLLNAQTLFSAARRAGLVTAAVGKSGPAYLQDFKREGLIIDENTVWPLESARDMQSRGLRLPASTPNMYPAGSLTLAADNGAPTGTSAIVYFSDGKTTDPSNQAGGRHLTQNDNLTRYFTEYVLPVHSPDLSLIWLRTVDATEHDYGPGSANALRALRAQDEYLGRILAQLASQQQLDSTNILIASDHSHSTVSGPLSLFPLRGAEVDGTTGKNKAGAVSAQGYSVSGYVRSADLLTRAGFHAYDGVGCDLSPVLGGIRADGSPVYPVQTDTSGSLCGTAGAKYTTPAYAVPTPLPADAIVVAAPGGSDQFYLPSQDPALVRRLVAFLQTREEYGAIFVDTRYGNIPGTFPATDVNLQNASGRSPDVTVSFSWDDSAVVEGKPGIEFSSYTLYRGMHGSFSQTDVRNTLVAAGPDFKQGYSDSLPSGNVDVAPTVAYLLGLPLPTAQGRVLHEALVRGGIDESRYTTTPMVMDTAQVSGLKFQLPTDPSGAALDGALKGDYSAALHLKHLVDSRGKTYTYFDFAKATRK